MIVLPSLSVCRASPSARRHDTTIHARRARHMSCLGYVMCYWRVRSLTLEQVQGACALDSLQPAVDVELAVDALEVIPDCPGRDDGALGDLVD